MNVSAQFPDHVITGGTAQVVVTVVYSGASIPQGMMVLIADYSISPIAAPPQGVVDSSPDACIVNSSACHKFYLRFGTSQKFGY